MIQHFRFVRNHHRKIGKVAIVTDGQLGELAERVASHFVAASVRRFPAAEGGEAKAWIAVLPSDSLDMRIQKRKV